jgi:hypothetical protein
MDNQSSATMNLEQLQQYISSQVQQHTTPLHNQILELENTNHQLRAVVNGFQAGQNIGQQFNQVRGNVKASKPKTYKGERGSDPEVWLFQFNQYADISQIAEEHKVKLAATYLEGNAATWWRNMVMQSEDGTGDYITWEEFQHGLVSIFKPVNSRKIARDRLAALRQTNSVAKYNFDFTQLCLEIKDISESEKLDKYVRGLKDKIRMEVELAEPRTLMEAMSKAQRIDNITYQSYFSSNHSNRITPRDNSAMDLSTINGDVALSAIKQASSINSNSKRSGKQFTPSQRLSQEDFKYCQKNRLCLRCKEPGHLARYCNKPIKPLNLKAR